jgi:type II secretory ATPase GspE/PulE/Tfp pilus assembly ATPase PilB-like protein
MVDWNNEDLLRIAGIDNSNLDEQSDRETLKLVDRYFNQCSLTEMTKPSVPDYSVYPIRALDPSIDLKDKLELRPAPVSVAPIVEFVNKMLSMAIHQRTQEVRLVPLSTQTLIRFNRGNGFYKPFQSPFSSVIMGAIGNRIRLIAGMTLMARNKPVMGKIRLRLRDTQDTQDIQEDKQFMVIVYTYPSTYGESLMLKGFTRVE